MMKKIYPLIVCALLLLPLCGSCDKVPMNGDLDGMWQLMSIEKGGQVTNVKSTKHYMSFQLHLVQFDGTNKNGDFQARLYYAHFKHTGDSLFIYDLAHHSENATEADNNVWFTEQDLPLVEAWGMYSLDNRFRVVRLNSDAMVLRRNDLVLTYRKF